MSVSNQVENIAWHGKMTKFSDSGNTEEKMLKFPCTKNILWDHTSNGSDAQISISYYRKPKLCISEKVLRFAHRHIESKGQALCGCALVGQLTIDDDGEGLTFTLDRFDPGGDSLNNSYSLTPGDMAVPFQVIVNSKNERQSSSDDYFQALQLLKQRCCSKNAIDLSNFLLTKGWCNIYTSGDKCVHHLEFDVVTLATEFKATSISPVPIVPTALSKNLSGPMSMSHLQGEPKTGYLTMDHTRKVLLVLESDPKVANLPLVGIWVSGVSFVYSPYIWACCLRFLHNSSLNDRVCVPPEAFLLVLYNPLHSKPEFYEVVTANGKTDLNFDLLNGYEVINLPKAMTSSKISIEMEMGRVDGGQKKDKFDGAINILHTQVSNQDSEEPRSSTTAFSTDEMTPRNIPAPHKSQLPVMTSMVPEVSLLFGEDSGICVNPKNPTIIQGRPNGVTHTKDFNRTKQLPNLPVLHEHPDVQHNKSAPRYNAQSESNFQNSAQNGRLAQHYLNSVPKPDNMVLSQNSYPSSKRNQTSQNVFPHNSSNFGQVNQMCTDPNYLQQNNSPHLNTMPSSGQQQRYLPHTTSMPHQRHALPQFIPNGHHAVPYQGYVPTQGVMGPPHAMQHLPTQNPHQMQEVQPGYHKPMEQQQYIPNSQGSLTSVAGPHGMVLNSNVMASIDSHGITPNIQGMRYHSQGMRPPSSQGTIPNSQGMMPQSSQGMMLNSQGMRPQSSQGMVHNTQNQFVPITPQVLQTRNFTVDQRPSSQADSSKSSDDSGLSVTPEKQIPPPKQSSKNSASNGETPDSVLQSKNINWNQVPPEVYHLLVQQDAQLKMLQSQIQMLIANQSNSSQNTTTTELDSQVTNKTNNCTQNSNSKSEMCSVAVNTTMFYPEKPAEPEHDSVSLQTSPLKLVGTQSSGETTPRQLSHCSDEGRTPAEIRHRGVLPFNSTQKDEFDLDEDLSSVAKNMALHDKTIDSIQSDMIVDMPSYHSSPTRSERSGDTLCNSNGLSDSLDKSPTSASMCCQQDDSEEEQDNVDTNDKEYYERLMDNIQVLLNQQSSDSPQGELTDTLQNDTLQQSIMLGQYINSIQHCRSGNTTREPLETTFIPKINYMSMMFDSDSDSSMEINAMAMKYLKDEQLTQMTKLQTRAKLAGNKGHQRVAMLRHILSDDKEATPNVTTMGMSPNDLTFATRKYMEKHGLLNDSKSSTTTANSNDNDSYQLRVNFSTITGRSESPVHITQDVINNDSYKTPVQQRTSSRLNHSPLIHSHNDTKTPVIDRSTPMNGRNLTNRTNSPLVHSKMNSPYIDSRCKSPVLDRQSNSPFVNSHTKSPFVNSQMRSPYINNETSEKQGRVNYHFTPSPGLQSSPQVVRETPKELDYANENQKHNYSRERPLYSEEDDKILDITRLRMLPKLL